MNRKLLIFLVIAFAGINSFLVEVVKVQFIRDHVLIWSIGSMTLATLIAVWAEKRKLKVQGRAERRM
jgi:hypothetical protein